jgi:hypothetical protein
MVESTLCIFCGLVLDELHPQTFRSKVCPSCWEETLKRIGPEKTSSRLIAMDMKDLRGGGHSHAE